MDERGFHKRVPSAVAKTSAFIDYDETRWRNMMIGLRAVRVAARKGRDDGGSLRDKDRGRAAENVQKVSNGWK